MTVQNDTAKPTHSLQHLQRALIANANAEVEANILAHGFKNLSAAGFWRDACVAPEKARTYTELRA